MIADLGFFALVIAFGVSIYAAIAAWYGNRVDEQRWVESARNAVVLVFPLVDDFLCNHCHFFVEQRFFN